MGRYRLSRSAREDLTEIVAYIATDSIDAALAISDRLEQSFTILGNNPEAGRERSEIAPDIRSFPTGANVILYSASDGGVLVVRLVHGARDLDELLGEE
jgi:toxin ParE1/3/4